MTGTQNDLADSCLISLLGKEVILPMLEDGPFSMYILNKKDEWILYADPSVRESLRERLKGQAAVLVVYGTGKAPNLFYINDPSKIMDVWESAVKAVLPEGRRKINLKDWPID